MRRNIFTQRVVGIRNSLPERVVEAGTFTTFKKYLDELLKCHSIQGYAASVENGIRIERCLMADANTMGRRASFRAVKLCDHPHRQQVQNHHQSQPPVSSLTETIHFS